MALYITSLNSGSNGNCYYVGNGEEAVLVDAGISCRETETRMKRLGLSMSTVKAIFVSHEHTDHVRGVPVLAQKYNLPGELVRRYQRFLADTGKGHHAIFAPWHRLAALPHDSRHSLLKDGEIIAGVL